MGGSGSGNFYHWQRPKKTTVEDCLSIDSNRWIREGILRSRIRLLGSWQCSYSGGKGFSLDYIVNTLDMQRPLLDLAYSGVRPGEREPRNESYTLRLTTTRPRFGGLRWWFICPLVLDGCPCGRRVGKLYLPPRGHYFGCRDCHALTYTSCQESGKPDPVYASLAAGTGWNPRRVERLMRHYRETEPPG